MSIGYTSYESACGGMITVCWDHFSTHIECDNCNDPIPKELSDEKRI